MCGIFGAIGEFDLDRVKMLALLNESRGKDSWGYYNGEHIFRGTGEIRDGIKTFRQSEVPIFLGHTRFKTTGAVKVENAHPFRFDNIIGAHNGIVTNHRELENEYGKEELEVDSQIIFYGLQKEGLAFLKRLEAYWGLWWYDLKEPMIVNLSNHDHTLAIGRINKALYFASDIEDLKRIGVKETWKVANDKLYRINIATLRFDKIRLKGLQGFYGSYDWRTRGGYSEYGATDTGKLLTLGKWPERGSTRPTLTLAEIEELEELEKKYYTHEGMTPMEEIRYERLMEKEKGGLREWA